MDADERRDVTLLSVGGRVVKVGAPMDRVLGWLHLGADLPGARERHRVEIGTLQNR